MPELSATQRVAARHRRVKRVGLAVASALVSVNIWTGGPLLAVYVGSRLQTWFGDSASSESMTAIFGVVIVLAIVEVGLTIMLTRIAAADDALTERPHHQRRTSPWLRSMRGEREDLVRGKQGISGVERIVVASVVLCILIFEGWFFFVAGSPLPQS